MQNYVQTHFAAYQDLICTLTRIPAPSFKEERRASFICTYLKNIGYDQAFIDEAGNVIVEIPGESDQIHLFAAHMDTVFPDETEIAVTVADGCIKAPGVGDDTANVCAILMTLHYLSENPIKPKFTTVFVFDTCEEGLGNLKGMRAVMTRYGTRLCQFVSLDLGYDEATVQAVGSRRFALTVSTPGGHSFVDFGAVNAIAIAADMIHDFYQIDTTQMAGKTTYNVGTIEGGTSVNTIAQSVTFRFEYRSDQMSGLEAMAHAMSKVLGKYENMKNVIVTVEKIGDRPSMGPVDPAAMMVLQEKTDRLIRRYTGVSAKFGSGSTDCNIPLSLGIPSICFGVYLGGGAHTREEYVRIDSLMGGLTCAMTWIVTDMMDVPVC